MPACFHYELVPCAMRMMSFQAPFFLAACVANSQMELVLAAGFQVDFIDAPIFQIIAEGHDAHLIDYMQFTGAIKVKDRLERTWVDVKKVFVLHQGIRVATFQDFFMSQSQG